MLRIESAGLLSLIQDKGRPGLRHLGIPASGALVPAWMRVANALVGNKADTPIIECHEGGLQLSIRDQAIIVAVAGDATASSTSANGASRSLKPWQSHVIGPGSTFTISSSGRFRLAVLAIAGFSPTMQLGSASTYLRASLGGIDGRELQAGDELSVVPAENMEAGWCCPPLLPNEGDDSPRATDVISIAAVPGPQQDAFLEQTLQDFFSEEYTLTREADRMGARLLGPTLIHKSAAARDIVSDAIVPGSVQVPGNGQPIVLLADAHTAGGYPKIATVLTCDLERLAIYRTGQRFRFQQVDVLSAVTLTRQHNKRVERHCSVLTKAGDATIDPSLLMQQNLIGGVVDAKA